MAELHKGATITPTKPELVQAWMASQRWYAAKGTSPSVRRLASWRLGDPAGEVGVETLVVADDSGPAPVVYQVPSPTACSRARAAARAGRDLSSTRCSADGVYDAPHDPVYAAQLLELVQGRVRAESTAASDAFDETVVAQPGPAWTRAVTVRSSKVLSGEQSNTSVVLDCVDSEGTAVPVIVKVFRMLSAGENPDVVLQSALVEAGSRRVPAVVGSVAGQWPEPGSDGEADAEAGAGPRSAWDAYGHFAFAQEFLPASRRLARALAAVRAGGTSAARLARSKKRRPRSTRCLPPPWAPRHR